MASAAYAFRPIPQRAVRQVCAKHASQSIEHDSRHESASLGSSIWNTTSAVPSLGSCAMTPPTRSSYPTPVLGFERRRLALKHVERHRVFASCAVQHRPAASLRGSRLRRPVSQRRLHPPAPHRLHRGIPRLWRQATPAAEQEMHSYRLRLASVSAPRPRQADDTAESRIAARD
jgi:hypothetical protein